ICPGLETARMNDDPRALMPGQSLVGARRLRRGRHRGTERQRQRGGAPERLQSRHRAVSVHRYWLP
ncbi:MAG TPA: hypothetical protein VIV09_08085, partial [Pseudolabrys sp.]